MQRRTLQMLGTAVLASFMLACGGGSANTITQPDPTIRLVNLAQIVKLDLNINDTTAFSNVSPGAAGSGQYSLASEAFEFSINENGSSVVIDSQTTTISKNVDTLAIAFGKKDFGAENEKRLRFEIYSVDRSIPNGNKSRVYVFNSMLRASGEDAFSVIFKNPGTNPTLTFDAVGYGQIGSREIDSGTVTLAAQRQFTETDVVTITKEFLPGKIYLMVFGGEEPTPTVTFFEIQPK